MEKKIKEIEHSTVLSLVNQIEYSEGQIVNKTLNYNDHHRLTLFAFDKGQEISPHHSNGDAMVFCLDGKAKITIGEKSYILNKGETIIMPAKIDHALYSEERFKILLIAMFD